MCRWELIMLVPYDGFAIMGRTEDQGYRFDE